MVQYGFDHERSKRQPLEGDEVSGHNRVQLVATVRHGANRVGLPWRLRRHRQFAGNQIGQRLIVEILVDGGVLGPAGTPTPQGRPQRGELFWCRAPAKLNIAW